MNKPFSNQNLHESESCIPCVYHELPIRNQRHQTRIPLPRIRNACDVIMLSFNHKTWPRGWSLGGYILIVFSPNAFFVSTRVPRLYVDLAERISSEMPRFLPCSMVCRVAFGRMMSHVEVECTDAPSSISFDNDLPVSQSLFRSARRTSFTNGNAPSRLGISKSTPLGKRDSIRVCIGSACA